MFVVVYYFGSLVGWYFDVVLGFVGVVFGV